MMPTASVSDFFISYYMEKGPIFTSRSNSLTGQFSPFNDADRQEIKIMEITAKKMQQDIINVIKAGLVAMISGAPGIGKSDMIMAIGKTFKLKVIDVRLAQMDPTELSGLPMLSEDRMDYAPPEQFPLDGIDEIPDGHAGFLLFLDEFSCHDDQTEIMTSDGWVMFKDLSKKQHVAQYNQHTREISFVQPTAYTDSQYDGDMVSVGGPSSKLDFCVTPNHDILLHRSQAKGIPPKTFKMKAAEITPKSYEKIPVGGAGTGSEDILTEEDKLAIVFQADGTIKCEYKDGIPEANKQQFKSTHDGTEHVAENLTISFGFKKKAKIAQFEKDFSTATKYSYDNLEGVCTFTIHSVDPKSVDKNFWNIFDITTFSKKKAQAFLAYLVKWDGFSAGLGFGYSNTNKASVDFVQQVAILAGYRASISTAIDHRKESYNTCYKVHIYESPVVGGQSMQRTLNKKTAYSGRVYCVTVPDGNIITRRNNKVLISGNSAPMAVQAAAYKLVLDRKVGKFDLHKNTAIVCAGNDITHGAIANRLSTAMQSRLVHMNLTVSSEDWLDWAAQNGIDYRITSFIEFRPEILHKFDPDHNDQTFACPRTWEFANRLIKKANNLDDYLSLLSGTLSEGVAREFVSYTGMMAVLPTMKDIIADPKNIDIDGDPALLYAVSHMVAANITGNNINPLMDYLGRLPIEFMTIAIKTAIKRDPNIYDLPQIKNWMNKLADEIFA